MAASEDVLAEHLGLSVVRTRDASGQSPLLEPEEEVHGRYADVKLVLGADLQQGAGQLLITTR